jgi:hypothetical protein
MTDTQTCTHCDDPILPTQPGAVDAGTDDVYHRECYCQTFQRECPHCNNPINLDHTTEITRNGYYHTDCYIASHADHHCTTYSTPVLDGKNMRKTTAKNGDTNHYCRDCYDDLNAENALDMRENINEFRDELDDLFGDTPPEHRD